MKGPTPKKSGVKRAGFVALAGVPNAGKSTLVNQLLGRKVSIMSRLPQTTRHRVCGILTEGDTQAVLVDVPGILAAPDKFNRTLVETAEGALRDCDLALHVRELATVGSENERLVVERLRALRCPVWEIRNKVDLGIPKKPPPQQDETCDYAESFRISARTGKGIAKLKEAILAAMPEGDWLFPEDDLSDRDLRFLCAELVREKTFQFLRQELPYGIGTWVEEWEELPGRPIRMKVVIQTERESHKPMIIGAKGDTLKKIGTAARRDIEALCGGHVFLELRVVVREGWRKDVKELKRMGLKDSN